jgi:adenosylhomocysteine nucleosidase
MPAEPVAVLILAALPQEVRPFLRLARARRLAGLGVPAWDFPTGAGRGVLALSGMGQEAAKAAAAALLARFQPSVLISAGFAGALGPDLQVGQVVVAAAFWQYQPQTGELEESPGPPLLRPWEDLLARLREAGLPACLGTFVTCPGVIRKADHRATLSRLSHPVLEVESAALAALANRRGLPFCALRAITDPAQEEIPAFIAQAVSRSVAPTLRDAVGWLRQDWRRLPLLLRFWRASLVAAHRLARGLKVVLEAKRS